MASPSISTESARSAVEYARTPATDSYMNMPTLIHSTVRKTRRCRSGIVVTAQHSSIGLF